MTTETRRWTRDHRAERVWWDVPVDVPAGCAGLRVTLEVDRPDAVVDLGCSEAAGWRGWSGGARRTFFVGADWATPGYLPGPIEPGRWDVVLGLHRVPADGVTTMVTVSLGAETEPPTPPSPPFVEAPPRRSLPAPQGMQWLAGDFHSHTVHSDGVLTPEELAAYAATRGLDVLAVTDHNTTSHHRLLGPIGARYGIGLVPGQEVTTDRGHANAFGDIGWVDFRRHPSTWVGEVADRGGSLSINHPLGGDCSWRWPLDVRPPLAEVWHSSWLSPTWGGPVAWWEAWGTDTVPVGGSDFHRFGSDGAPGSPTTWVCVDAAAETPAEWVDAALAGLRAGRTTVSRTRAAPVALPMGGGEVVVLGAAGSLLIGPDGSAWPVRSDRQTVSGRPPGGHYLIDHDGAVLAVLSVF